MSNSLRPHGGSTPGLHPSLTPRVYSNSYPLSRWCHSTISFSVGHFSSCLQSFSVSGSFPMSQFFTSGGQSIGASVSTSVIPMNTQDWFPLGWIGWIYLQSKGFSRVFYNQFSSIAQLCPALCDPMIRSMPGLPVHHHLLVSTQTHVHWVGDAIQPFYPLSSPSPPALNLLLPSIRKWVIFSNESPLCIRWPKYWSFSFNNSTSNEHSGLISFRMDWLDLLAVQWLSKVFSNITVEKNQFFSAQPSL